MEKQYNVKITKYALSQMKEIRVYIAYELLAPQAAYDLFSEMKENGKQVFFIGNGCFIREYAEA